MLPKKSPSRFVSCLRRYGLLILLLFVLIVFFHFHLSHFFTFEKLRANQTAIVAWTASHYIWAVFAYIAVFALLIACTVPCATVFTLAGGFLFGNMALGYALASMLLGGSALYLAVRVSLGPRFAKATGWLKSFEDGFQQNAFYYLLTIRLVPILPCWISNIGAGLMNVPYFTFMSATLLGIFPSTLIYVLAGRSLDKIVSNQTLPLRNIVLDPFVLFPLLGLALLSMMPVLYKYSLKKRKQNR
jgi:uncharacterized membrane protein YdjX (TVP38/TMEM64 family)